MEDLLVRPFKDADVGAAGQLLAARHTAHRLTEPLLPATFADQALAITAVQAAWDSAGASGAVALTRGKMTGYLLGAPKLSAAWGPNIWVDAVGCAVSEAEVVRDLYATAAQRWVDEGNLAHYVMVPSDDEAQAIAWSRLAFGQQQQHAIRDVLSTQIAPPSGVRIRLAVREDVPILAALDLMLPAYQRGAPVFSAKEPETLAEQIADWDENFDDRRYTNFVADLDGSLVGAATGCSLELSGSNGGPLRPVGAAYLGFAAVLEAARGRGVGRALGEAVLAWAGEAGYQSVVVDWRVTNLLASRTWPRLGFRPTFVRMHRLVGY